MTHNVIIIGGGCAGLTAGIYCGRALMNPLLFAGTFEDKGGLLIKTSVVENYPGFPNGIDGSELVYNMESQAIKYGTKIIDKEIIKVDFSEKLFRLTDSDGTNYHTKVVIICTGSNPIKLGLPNENKFWSNGISSCAVCDGALYRGKKIIVVGGGDSAMEEALFLTKFSEVTLIHRRNTLRASKIMQDRVLANPKIKIIYDTIIIELVGDTFLKSVVCQNVVSGEKFTLEVDGLFYGLGLKPNTDLFKKYIETDLDGYIIRYRHPEGKYKTMTSINGIFVAGDCHDKKYRQAITAAGDGCKAALDVEKYLEEHFD